MYYRTSQVLKAQQTIYFGNEISLLRIACMFIVLTMHTSSKLNTTNFDCEFIVIFACTRQLIEDHQLPKRRNQKYLVYTKAGVKRDRNSAFGQQIKHKINTRLKTLLTYLAKTCSALALIQTSIRNCDLPSQ